MQEPQNAASQTESGIGQTIPFELITETDLSQTAKKDRQTKTANGQTTKNKGGRPPRQTTEAKPWIVRGVDVETRAMIEKAATRHGRATLGDFFNNELREYCAGQVKKSATPPASPQDVETLVEAKLTTFGQSLKGELIADLQRLMEQSQTTAPEQKKGFFARLFS